MQMTQLKLLGKFNDQRMKLQIVRQLTSLFGSFRDDLTSFNAQISLLTLPATKTQRSMVLPSKSMRSSTKPINLETQSFSRTTPSPLTQQILEPHNQK
jgi:hypothetical protein